MRPGNDGELARRRVRVRHRDTHREAAAPVGVATERAVLVPREVGDAFDHADRLLEGLDRLGRLVLVTGEAAEPEQALVLQHRGGGRAVPLEALEAHRPVLTRRRTRPPRVAVIGLVVSERGVDVAGHRSHLVRVEQAADVKEPGLGQEVRHLLVVVIR